MENNYSVTGIHTGIIRPGDDIVTAILDAEETKDMGGLKEGDVIVIAESALATSESRLVRLGDVSPSDRAYPFGRRYGMDPREVEVVINESDSIVGGIQGFLLCMKNGTLLPNAGVDASNAPPGTWSRYPKTLTGVQYPLGTRYGNGRESGPV